MAGQKDALRQKVRALNERLTAVEAKLAEPVVVYADQVKSWCGPGEAVWDWRGKSEPAVLSCSSLA